MTDMGRQLYNIGSGLQRLSIWAGMDIVDDLTSVIEELTALRTAMQERLEYFLRLDAEKETR